MEVFKIYGELFAELFWALDQYLLLGYGIGLALIGLAMKKAAARTMDFGLAGSGEGLMEWTERWAGEAERKLIKRGWPVPMFGEKE